MASFITAAYAAISASSIGSAIVRIIVAYGISRLINGSPKDQPQARDEGVRLQLQPNTTNPIPLLYGSAYYGGNITDAQLTNNNQTMWVCMTLSEHTTQNRLSDNAAVDTFIEEVYYNNQLVSFKADGITIDYVTNSDGSIDTSPRDLVKIYLYKNGSTNPTLPYDYLGGTLPGAAYSLFPGWDSNWAMTNLTFALVRVDYNRDKGITGIPDLRFKVSNTLYKPGDALYDYMTNTISGAALPASAIDTTSLIALNNYADDEINFYNEDTDQVEVLGDRYQVNGVINPQQNVLDNLKEIANSVGVFINYDIATGKWGVIINKDETALLHFDDSNITSGIDVTATSLDSQYNAIEIEFPNRFIQDQTDVVRITLPPEFLNDNEPENVLNVKLSMLNEAVQAREIAYIELYQNRYDRVVTFATDYSKINIEAGDVITLTSDIYGFDNQTLRVVRVREIETEDGNIGIEITAQEYDSTLYTAGGQPRRPRTPTAALNLPSLGVIATPNAPLITTSNNNAQPSILLTGTVPTGVVDRFEFWYSTDDFVSSFLIHEEKNANGAPFNSATTIAARVATLPAGTYKFKVRAGNEISYSDYSPATAALEWVPVQTTDEITNETGFSFSDLLPAIAAGVLGYLAYKTLYPQLLEALSDTELGQLLGITSPSELEAIKEQAELQANAFRFINVDGVSLSSAVDPTITFVAGENITITADDVGHEITISATGFGQLDDLADVNLITPADGDVLLYDDQGAQWVNVPINNGTGITVVKDPIDGITISATGEADATNAYSRITVGGTTLDAGVTAGHLYIQPGEGIKFTSNANTNTITIDNLCCDDTDVDTTSFKDAGVPNITELDDCKQTVTWPEKNDVVRTPAVPTVPQTWITIINAGTWYDECYRTSVPTLILDDPDNLIDIDIGETTTLTGKLTPTTTLEIDWIDTAGAIFEDKQIELRKVGVNEYVALKNWKSTDGTPVDLIPDYCDINDPWSRPLFTTTDYPNGYEFATFSNLQNLLVNQGSVLRFIYVAEVSGSSASDTPVAYPGKVEVVKQPRTCVKTLTATVAIARIDFQGTISTDVLWLEPETPGGTDYPAIPIGSYITGSFTSSARQDLIEENTTVIEEIASNRYLLNKQYPTLAVIDATTAITMYYGKKIQGTVQSANELSVDYNNASEDFGVYA